MIAAILTNRYVLASAAILVIIGSGMIWLKSHEQTIRATVVAEYQPKIDQLEADVDKANDRIIYERSEAAKNARASAAYSAERVVIYRQVQEADNVIQAEIADGTLPNAAINPVKVATIGKRCSQATARIGAA